MKEITIGKESTAVVTVDKTNIASAVGSGDLEVFSTPMMIALMERAACEALNEFLEKQQTTVGTFISVNHNAASKIGARITATAKITSVSGRKIEFEITANDDEKEIGNATHTRVLVDRNRFMEKLL